MGLLVVGKYALLVFALAFLAREALGRTPGVGRGPAGRGGRS